jgi:hypothetical protein
MDIDAIRNYTILICDARLPRDQCVILESVLSGAELNQCTCHVFREQISPDVHFDFAFVRSAPVARSAEKSLLLQTLLQPGDEPDQFRMRIQSQQPAAAMPSPGFTPVPMEDVRPTGHSYVLIWLYCTSTAIDNSLFISV